MKHPCVYMLASKRNGTLYIGVTSDLQGRMSEHVQSVHKGFTKQYRVNQLVHHEYFDQMDQTISREKFLKSWKRAWKISLIEQSNPEWLDLYDRKTGEIVDPLVADSQPVR